MTGDPTVPVAVPAATPAAPRRLAQIDILKGLAILGVLILHSSDTSWLHASLADLHVWQSVPVFAVLLGLNGALSMAKTHGGYWKRRAWRVLPPFFAAFVVSGVLALVMRALDPAFHINVGGLTLLGQMPSGGPGNYYITVIFEFTVLLPIVWAAFRRFPRATVAAMFAADIAFELAAPHLGIIAAHPYLYSSCVLRYLGAIALGMWITEGVTAKRVWWVLALLPVSLAYLLAADVAGWHVPLLLPDWQPQNAIAFPYAAALVILGLRLLPASERSAPARWLATLGRASYHIFLVQILLFASILPLAYAALRSVPLAYPPLAVAVCVGAGLAFQLLLPDRRRTVVPAAATAEAAAAGGVAQPFQDAMIAESSEPFVPQDAAADTATRK